MCLKWGKGITLNSKDSFIMMQVCQVCIYQVDWLDLLVQEV